MRIAEMLEAVRAVRLSGSYRNSLGDGLIVNEQLDHLAERVEAVKQAGTITRKTEARNIREELQRLTREVRALRGVLEMKSAPPPGDPVDDEP